MIYKPWQPWYWGLGILIFILFAYNVNSLFIVNNKLDHETKQRPSRVFKKNIVVKTNDYKQTKEIEKEQKNTDTEQVKKNIAGIADVPKVVLRPKVAIIIDDLGNSLETARLFIEFPYPITFSILPKTPRATEIGLEAVEEGNGVMLHLPMEAEIGNEKLGDGAILTTMNEEEIRRQVEEDLAFLPMASGVNNHMGSKASGDLRVVKAVIKVLQKKDLFVVDSWTSPASVFYITAKHMQVPSAKRDVFLDNEHDVSYIKEQIKQLLALAKKNGLAIGIGHPYLETIQALNESLDAFEKAGVDFVLVEEIVKK